MKFRVSFIFLLLLCACVDPKALTKEDSAAANNLADSAAKVACTDPALNEDGLDALTKNAVVQTCIYGFLKGRVFGLKEAEDLLK